MKSRRPGAKSNFLQNQYKNAKKKAKAPRPNRGPKPVQNETISFPMRINKYLAWKGFSTRRGADELITNNKVRLNGELAVLGDKVNETDTVVVAPNKKPAKYYYFAYNKPSGVITHSPQKGEIDISHSITGDEDDAGAPVTLEAGMPPVFPLGRLDKNSHGLIILTNDGRITDRLLNPKYTHEKEYIVTTVQKLRSSFKEKMEAGVQLEDYVTKPCKVEIINENMFRVTLTEGKKHQIRRMVTALFNEVKDLKRVQIMNIHLGKLAPNGYRPIEGKELNTFLAALGIN